MYVIENTGAYYYPYDRYHVLPVGILYAQHYVHDRPENHSCKAAAGSTCCYGYNDNLRCNLKNDGNLYLGDAPTDMQSLITQSSIEQKNNPRFAIVIRADKDVDYGRVIELIDKLKGAGITRFGLATDGAGK